MGSIGDFVSIVLSLSNSVSPSRQGFGVPLVAAHLSAAMVAANPARWRVYNASSALAGLVTDGALTTDPIYRAFEVMLAQPNVPPQIALGRRLNTFTQTLTVTFTSAVAGDIYVLTTVGTDGVQHQHTLTSTGVPATDCTAFAALLVEANIGTVTHASAVMTITQTAGSLTDLQAWSPKMTIANTTADAGGSSGLSADLAAIAAANSIGWYGLALDSNDDAALKIAVPWVEAQLGGKFGFFDSATTANCTAGSGDVNSILEAATYQQSWLQQSNKAVLSYLGAGTASQMLAKNPGAWQGSYKSITGVIADDDQSLTETQRQVLNTASTATPGTGGKNGNWYATVNNVNVTWPGVAPGGRWVDNTIFCNWLQANAQADLFAFLAGQDKVPFDDPGLQAIGGILDTRMKIGGRAPYGGLILSTIVVTVPSAASIDQMDINDRNLTGLSATAQLTGGVNTIGIQITVTE